MPVAGGHDRDGHAPCSVLAQPGAAVEVTPGFMA